LQFSVQVASPETFGYTLICVNEYGSMRIEYESIFKYYINIRLQFLHRGVYLGIYNGTLN